MKKLFGTDGIRGEAGQFPLDEHTVKTIGSSLASEFYEKNGLAPVFLTGRDTRESGEWIEKAFVRGASSGGAKCESAGVVPTPGVAYLTKAKGFDAGIVISASHNPFQDNGIKVFLPSGEKLDETTECAIEKSIFGNLFKEESGNDLNDTKAFEFQADYLNHLSKKFKDLSLSDFRIVVDCAHGATSYLAPKLFEDFDAEVVAINNEPDGKNINLGCGSLHLEKLREKVLEKNADLGIAFDGDADRSLFVDENGGVVDGDATLWIMAQHLKTHGKLVNNTVVATVMSNIGLEIALKSKGMRLLRTSVGDKYVLRELLKTNASVGGEQSGHIIFPARSMVGDGMQTALYLLEALRENDKSLSEMKRGFTQFPQILVNVKVAEKIPFEEVVEIPRKIAEIERGLGDSGRLLLRYSGTENLARVMIEGGDQTEIEERANDLAEIIKEKLGNG